MVPGTGILLNNQMDDFSSKPGAANAYGLIGGKCNAIEPGKRMLSSMTPTFLFKEDGTLVATGSPGGSRIINVVLQMIVNIVDHNLSVAEATVAPRFHHQWFPDVLNVEKGFSPDTIRLLSSRGHKLKKQSAMGSTQTVSRQDGLFVGFSDLRRRNSLTVGVPTYVDRPAKLLAGDRKPRIEKASMSVSPGGEDASESSQGQPFQVVTRECSTVVPTVFTPPFLPHIFFDTKKSSPSPREFGRLSYPC